MNNIEIKSSIFANINNINKELLNIKFEKNQKSLGQILLNRIKKNKELENILYNSEYIQEKQDEEEKKNINKYKNNSFEISSQNNININPVLKNNIMSIKEYFNKSGKKLKKKDLRASYSFDISFNLESI